MPPNDEGTSTVPCIADLVERHTAIAERLARRYSVGTRPDPDLVQVAVLGLVGAATRFDPSIGPFRPFAVSTIHGELKKHLRANGWAVRVPRRLQELSISVAGATDQLEQELGRSPTPAEVSACTGHSVEDVLAGLRARSARFPTELPATDPPVDAALDRVVDRIDIGRAMGALSSDDLELLLLRFEERLTQRQIAARLGTSQTRIHRRLTALMVQLRSALDPPQGEAS